jgi:hypothetical protein
VIAGTANGAQVVANAAKALVIANWSTFCYSAWLTAMGAPGLPSPVAGNIFTSQRSLFTAESQPKVGLTVIRTDGVITDALGALDQTHELEVSVCSDWGYYDGTGAHPLTTVQPFTIEAYETAVRAYVEGIVMILCSATYGFINYDARNQSTPGFTATGIYNCLPSSGLTPVDFVVGEDDTGQTLIQQTVRASIQVLQRRSLAR